MTTKAITPLRQRMIEDMSARKLCAEPSTAISAAASGSPRFSSDLPTRLHARTSAASSCTWPTPA
jgi:hypothetical protein